MILVTDSVHTDLDPQRAWEYLRDFTNLAEWDPGTPEVEPLTAGPVAVGHRYLAQAEFNGKRTPIEYVVTELSERSITLRGENHRVISVDTISVDDSGNGSRVDYRAEFTLKGVAKLLEPFLRGRFQALAGPAMTGLRTRLSQLG